MVGDSVVADPAADGAWERAASYQASQRFLCITFSLYSRQLYNSSKRHGPYHQMSVTRKGKSSTKFVKTEDLPIIYEQLTSYERMKKLVDRWIELSMKLSNLRRSHQGLTPHTLT